MGHQWSFGSTITVERKNNLVRATGFSELIDEIAKNAKVICAHRDESKEASGYCRYVFTLELHKPLFDYFFNSEHGYRGAYFKSPYEGIAANDLALKMLTPKLLEAGAIKGVIGAVSAEESLTSPSAKIWLVENGKTFKQDKRTCTECDGGWSSSQDSTIEVDNGRWLSGAGIKAPWLSKLQVMGAFVNERHDVWIPQEKRFRAEEIYQTGWAGF